MSTSLVHYQTITGAYAPLSTPAPGSYVLARKESIAIGTGSGSSRTENVVGLGDSVS
ncbi:hypothetical protein FKW77_006465 [Venturia effusa]|uniref:Uncharacterized protein n=1 Tax=Venturia effusa TaxID=50376 RepID=A0A517L9G8_9PEZI|nr:hypothetical protein FKW77_006465 [Venturia effusa]